MRVFGKIVPRKCSITETLKNELNSIYQSKHSRHRSFIIFLNNIMSGLITYSFLPKIKFPIQINLFFNNRNQVSILI